MNIRLLSKTGSFVFLIVLFVFGVDQVVAQSATATLTGTVMDERGAAIAGANITITDTSKSVERLVVTNSDGFFIAPQLSPSRYKIKVQQSGFATMELSEVVLNVGDQSAVRIQMKVAQVGETVNVVDAAVTGDSPGVATLVDRQFVENQPFNGRSFQTLVELSPGVVVTPSNLVWRANLSAQKSLWTAWV